MMGGDRRLDVILTLDAAAIVQSATKGFDKAGSGRTG
jgi:hypothetical protein